jgi:hypothetical protein
MYSITTNNTSNNFNESVLTINATNTTEYTESLLYLGVLHFRGGMPSCPGSPKPLVQVIRSNLHYFKPKLHVTLNLSYI